MFAVVVAEEVRDPSFRGQNLASVFGKNLRGEAPGRNEHAGGRFGGLKIEAFAWLKLDSSYPEIRKSRNGSPDHAMSLPAVRDPKVDRPWHVETNDFEPERVEIQPVSARVGDEPVGVVLARATAPSTLPNAPLDEVGDAGLKVKPNEGTLSGGGEPIASRGPMGVIRNKLRDSATRKEDGVGLSIRGLSHLLSMAADPKNPLQIGERNKVLESRR